MTETKEETYHGVWFLPESEIKVQGYLRVTDFTIELYLTDPDNRSLDNDKDQTLDRQNFPVIHGTGRYQEKITLYECSGFVDNFDAKLMLYGDTHYKSIDEQKFKILGVHIPYFDRWISFNSFKKEITNSGYNISYKTSERIECKLNSEITLSIEFECFAPTTENRNKISLHEFALVQFTSNKDEGMSLSELFKYLLYFQQMVSFLARDGANISVARVYPNEQEFKRNKFLGTMIYGSIPFNKFQYGSKDHLKKFLIHMNDLKPDVSLFLKKWFDFAATGQHIIQLIFQDYFFRGAFDENNFLNLIRALEIYHAYKFPGNVLPSNEYKEKLNTIIKNIPEEYKDEVKDHLQFKNEFTLDQRLTRLLEEIDGIKIGYDYDFSRKFIINVKNSRNYYTHYNPARKKKAATGDELIHLTETCRALINFLLLKHLGISNALLTKRFEHYFEYSYYSNYFL